MTDEKSLHELQPQIQRIIQADTEQLFDLAKILDLKIKALAGAKLSGADLSDIDLSDADLCDADLSGANLSNTDMRGANLRGADLRGADLRNTNLSDADLSSAMVEKARFRDNSGLTEDTISELMLRGAIFDYSPKLVHNLVALWKQGLKKTLLILEELTDSDIDWMLAVGSKKAIPTGTVLIHEGGQIDALYIVLDGRFTVAVKALEGKEIASLSRGEVIGEMSFLKNRLPSATVKALENSVVMSIPRMQLLAKLQQDTAFASRFYQALAIVLSDKLLGNVNQLSSSKDLSSEDTERQNEQNIEVLDNPAAAEVRLESLLKGTI